MSAASREREVAAAYRLLWALVDEMSLTHHPEPRTVLRWMNLLDGVGQRFAEAVKEDRT